MAKERLRLALGVEWPKDIDYAETKGVSESAVTLTRRAAGDRVAGVLLGTPQIHAPIVLVVDPGGSDAALTNPEVVARQKRGERVLAIDAFQTGRAIVPRDRSHQHFLTFNLSDDACRVQDILTALAFIRQSQKGPVELIGLGKAAVWAYFAAAIAPLPVKLHADIANFKGTDQDFLRLFNVPGIQRAGGLEAAKRALTQK